MTLNIDTIGLFPDFTKCSLSEVRFALDEFFRSLKSKSKDFDETKLKYVYNYPFYSTLQKYGADEMQIADYLRRLGRQSINVSERLQITLNPSCYSEMVKYLSGNASIAVFILKDDKIPEYMKDAYVDLMNKNVNIVQLQFIDDFKINLVTEFPTKL